MTGKGQRHDRRGSRRRHLLVAATALLVVGLGCEEAGRQASPFVPEPMRLEMTTVDDMQVRVRRSDGAWSQWETVVDSMSAAVPISDTLLLQFKQGTHFSSLAGFSYPELDVCFVMPEHYRGVSSWRVSYGPDPGPYPQVGRIEMRPDETHVTQVRSRIMWFMAEKWDDDAASYLAASPWFQIRFVQDTSGYDFHQDEEVR